MQGPRPSLGEATLSGPRVGQGVAMVMVLVVKAIGEERLIDIPLFAVTDLYEDGASLHEDLLIKAKECVIVEHVISKGSDVDGANESVIEYTLTVNLREIG